MSNRSNPNTLPPLFMKNRERERFFKKFYDRARWVEGLDGFSTFNVSGARTASSVTLSDTNPHKYGVAVDFAAPAQFDGDCITWNSATTSIGAGEIILYDANTGKIVRHDK